MKYTDLVQLYFDRSNALQWHWTLYVAVIAAVLVFSSLRQRHDRISALLITTLYIFFAYSNQAAIRDISKERFAILTAVQTHSAAPNDKQLRDHLEPTLSPPDYSTMRNFRIASDSLTIAALWAMELRRRKTPASGPASDTPKRPRTKRTQPSPARSTPSSKNGAATPAKA